MNETKSPFLRLVTVNSDESTVPRATRTVALLNPDTGRYLEGVTATVRLLEPGEYQAIETKHRAPKQTAKGLEWETDTKAVTLEVLVTAVESWTGIVGADHKPIKVCPPALKALDEFNKAHLAGIARTPAEVVDAALVDASFRQPAGVAGVAG